MKILAVTTNFKTDLVEAITKNIVRLYEAMSGKATVSLLMPGRADERVGTFPFETYSYSAGSAYGSGWGLWRDLVSLRRHLLHMDYSDYDVMHLHVGFTVELSLLRRALQASPIPVVVTIWQPYVTVGDMGRCVRQRSWRLIRGTLPHAFFNSGLWRPFYRRAAKGVSRVLFASHYQAKQAATWCAADKIQRLPNGVTPPSRPVSGNAERSSGKTRLLYLGHETPAKGVDLFLAALSQLREVPWEVTLALSDRSDLPRLKRELVRLELADRVVLKGRVDVYGEMSVHDLFVVPYRMPVGVSYYPNVLLECMACGLPMVTADWPVTRELLGPLSDELLVPAGKSAILADRIRALVAQPERLRAVGRQLAAIYAEQYTLDRWVTRQIGEYSALEAEVDANKR